MLNWVELDAGALRWNLGQFRPRLAQGVRLGAVVKSNAYGHGMIAVADLAERSRTSNLDFELGQQEADRKLAESRALLPKILATIQTLGQTAQGVGTAIGGFKA